jgi:pimeloyl-ACP methyl ester carboxylesterase
MTVSQEFAIRNKQGLTLVGEVLRNPQNAGVAVVVHGIGAYRSEPLMQALTDAAYDAGMTVVRYDATNSFGESGGTLKDMRFTTHLDDLESVLHLVKSQSWGSGPFVLLGHSLGGAASLHYAAAHPDAVGKLVLVSCVVGGAWWLKAHEDAIPDTLKTWRASGSLPKSHPIMKDRSGEVSWAYAEDIQQRDFIENDASQVKCPALLVAGSIDPITPVAAQKDLQKALGGKTQLHVVQGCGHTYKSANQQQELKDTITAWLTSRDD